MKNLLKALAETLVGDAEKALEDNGTSLKEIDIAEMAYHFKLYLEARAE